MGRVTDRAKKLEAVVKELTANNDKMPGLLQTAKKALDKRADLTKSWIDALDEMEKQKVKSGAPDKKLGDKCEVLKGNVKAATRDFDTCKQAIKNLSADISKSLNSVERNEVAILIDEKEAKDKKKFLKSSSLKDLKKAIKEVESLADASKKNILKANDLVDDKDQVDIDKLFVLIPKRYYDW